jgi:hypothetical protein
MFRLRGPERASFEVLRRCGDHQRPSTGCDKDESVLRRGEADGSTQVPDSVRQVLNAQGSPLPPQLHREMQTILGADLTGVRIHNDGAAAASARDVGAKAWTLGHHVAFGRGAFAPESEPGRNLLAHELAHVIQQKPPGGPDVTAAPRVGSVNNPAKREAEQVRRAVDSQGQQEQVLGRDNGGAAAGPSCRLPCRRRIPHCASRMSRPPGRRPRPPPGS